MARILSRKAERQHGQHASTYDVLTDGDLPWAPSFAKNKYDPSEIFGPDVDLDLMEKPLYSDTGYVFNHSVCFHAQKCPHCMDYSAHTDSLVIAVDGHYSPSDPPSVGVFVGFQNKFNERVYIPECTREPATSQNVELHAGVQGLIAAIKIRTLEVFGEDESSLGMLVLKSDSEYLVKGMTERIFKWKRNGYKTNRGTPVINAKLFRILDGLVQTLEGMGVKVLFWHVPRARNGDADDIAKNGVRRAYYAEDGELDEYGDPKIVYR